MAAIDESVTYFMEQLRCLKGTFDERKACRAACTVDTCPLVLSYWGYRPNIPVNAAFAAIFVIFMTIVLVQGVWTRKFKKYTAMMFIGTVMEIIGYVARIYAYSYPFSDLSFITQLTTLTLAPAFFAAAIYFSLSRIVITFGAENSRIPPRLIPRIFISCDIVSLILQGGGGALAAYYAQKEKMPDNGNYTMIGGLSFQAFTLLIFLGLSADFGIRTYRAYRRHGHAALSEDVAAKKLRHSKRFRFLLFSLTASAVLIFMRSVYRVAEISEGWKGPLMTTEKFVIILEAVPVAISGLLLSVFHPANCFKDEVVVERDIELPETPPSMSSSARGQYDARYDPRYDVRTDDSEKSKNGSKYGSMHVTLDPTFDRKHWR